MKTAFIATILAMGLAAGTAQAAPVLGSHVDSSVFSAAIGGTSGWSYLGQSTSAFTGPGTGEIELRSAGASNSFGYGKTDHTGLVTVFSGAAAVGTVAAVAGLSPSYLLWFNSDVGLFDDNRQWTDGFDTGGFIGEEQGDIDIFFNAAATTWAFFFDDGGPGGFGDDNDYNDMVVTLRQGGVPEPATLSLLGLGLLTAGFARRHKRA